MVALEAFAKSGVRSPSRRTRPGQRAAPEGDWRRRYFAAPHCCQSRTGRTLVAPSPPRLAPALSYFGIESPHPHLHGGTVGDWPLNVFDEHQAAAELDTLRTIAAAEIHNLVFQTGGDYRIIPALLNRPSP